MVGDHDYLYAGDDPKAFVPDQKRAFSSASRVNVVLITNAAHDLALHRNAVQTNDLQPMGGSPLLSTTVRMSGAPDRRAPLILATLYRPKRASVTYGSGT
ncbi:hypothetical protein ACH4OY_20890 [Micromonospora rubida]|uniref:Uncharacterized protein n=1 Tax=Micromonospora rubida TaxID=2697657 RepID=A0ABW7ST42_9ACTN